MQETVNLPELSYRGSNPLRRTRRQNGRGGVENTYVDFERSEEIYLVIRDHE